jgi:hypothetical protein
LSEVARRRVVGVRLQIMIGFEAEQLQRRLHSVVSIQRKENGDLSTVVRNGMTMSMNE